MSQRQDYCTFWPEGWWASCCQAHDAAYAEQAGRAASDYELMLCVAQTAPEPLPVLLVGLTALAMYAGVRLFGSRFYRNSKPPL